MYRILMIPIIGYTIYIRNSTLYYELICINLISDWLDGFIARRFKWQSKLGATLDSIGDISTYSIAAIGFYYLEKTFIKEHANSLIAIVFMYILPMLSSFIRFRNIPSFHLYSSKIAAYISGLFIISFALWGYISWIYFVFICSVFVSEFEVFVASLILEKHRSDIRSIYFLIQQRKDA